MSFNNLVDRLRVDDTNILLLMSLAENRMLIVEEESFREMFEVAYDPQQPYESLMRQATEAWKDVIQHLHNEGKLTL